MTETLITSSLLITALIILRTLFKGRISSRVRYGLWLIAAVRLMLPFSIAESSVSVMNIFIKDTHAQVQETVPVYTEYTEYPIPEEAELSPPDHDFPEITEPAAPAETISAKKENISPIKLLKILRYGVTGIMLIWFAAVNISFGIKLLRERKPVSCEIPLKVYRADSLTSPCIFGLIKPSIYITADAEKNSSGLRCIIAHEYCHYLQGDMFWTVLRYILLAFYWFDPFVWAAAYLSVQDCECACDEAAIARIGEEHRRDYGETLLSMISRRAPFGVASTSMSSAGRTMKERIILIAKKPKNAAAALVFTLLAAAAAAGCTFTSAKTAIAADIPDDGRFMLRAVSEAEQPVIVARAYAVPRGSGCRVNIDIAGVGDTEGDYSLTAGFYFSDTKEQPAPAEQEQKNIRLTKGEICSVDFDVQGDSSAELYGSLTVKPMDADTSEEYVFTFNEDVSYYYSNCASDALTAFGRDYENYSKYYLKGAKAVYLDNMTVVPDENGRFGAVSNLWIEYGSNDYYLIPLRFSRKTESWYAENSGSRVNYGSWHGRLLENIPFEEKVKSSWEAYVRRNYPSFDGMELNGEPVTAVYILPVDMGSRLMPEAGFTYVSEHYHMTSTLVYEPNEIPENYSGYYERREEWVTPRGTGAPPFENDGEFYQRLKGYTQAYPEEELSKKNFRAGDNIYSFVKKVPAGDEYKEFTVTLAMTEEKLLPDTDRNTVRGKFILKTYDQNGGFISSQPVMGSDPDEMGYSTLHTEKSWLGQYFRYSKGDNRLIAFSRHTGYTDMHIYSAEFFGITEEGELFPYHIDRGEFPADINPSGDTLNIGNLYTNIMINHDPTAGAVNIFNDRSKNRIFSVMYFDESAHIIKNGHTAEGENDSQRAQTAIAAAKRAYCSEDMKYQRRAPLENDIALEKVEDGGSYVQVDTSIAKDEDSLLDYILASFKYSQHSREELREMLFINTAYSHRREGRVVPCYKMIDGKLCYLDENRGNYYSLQEDSLTAADFNGHLAVFFLQGFMGNYEVTVYDMEENTDCTMIVDGIWRIG